MYRFGSYIPLVNNSLSLETGTTVAISTLAYIASDFLVLLLFIFAAFLHKIDNLLFKEYHL